MDKYVGKRLDGRYEIQEIIGVGGMAVVYKAHDNVENRTVAIKILKDEFVSNEEFIRRFKNESKAIAVLSHPNIVKVYDVSFGDLIQYIVMEYIDGITLKEFIERQGSLRWKDAVHFTIQILKALQHAHDKGIVHRDVKPQNIMLLSDGTIKVADFGIARFARNEQRTITDKAIGSVHYISPEQARGEKTDEKADIYSVGVILYEMLTGKLPFDAESAVSVAIMQLQRDPKLPTEINPAIPLGLEQITIHAMQKVLERRYQSASEFLCDLEQFKKDPTATFDYTYFVDNSPTKFVDTIISSTPASAVAPIPDIDEEPEEEKQKSKMVPILAGIASALLIAIVVIVIIILSGGDKREDLSCPNFLGMTIEEAQEKYGDRFNLVFPDGDEWEYNSDYEFGEICGQSVKEGDKLRKNAEITLSVSRGVGKTTVPDVVSKDIQIAEEELTLAELQYEIIYIDGDGIDKDIVIKTSPSAGTKSNKGDTVTVYVSKGDEVEMVVVPGVVQNKKSGAVRELEEMGFVVVCVERDLEHNEDFVPKGYVIAQDIAEGEEVEKGSTITLEISTGIQKEAEYTYNVKIDVLDDLKVENVTGKFKITLNGSKKGESEEITFFDVTDSINMGEFTTKDTEVEYTVKIIFSDDTKEYYYGTLTIDTVNNTITEFKKNEGNSSYLNYINSLSTEEPPVEDNESESQES